MHKITNQNLRFNTFQHLSRAQYFLKDFFALKEKNQISRRIADQAIHKLLCKDSDQIAWMRRLN